MISMPWQGRRCPNAMIEVTDACNASCRACYKRRGETFKTIPEIEADIETAARLRKLHAITISGGEPTLHPQLCQVVQMIKRRGLHAFLLTNGSLIDEGRLERLKAAGLDSVLFHVDTGQDRSDLPPQPLFSDVRGRLAHLTKLASSFGLDVSISLTLYDGDLAALADFARFFFESREITFLFVARGVHPTSLLQWQAETSSDAPPPLMDSQTPGIRQFAHFFRDAYGIEPANFLPATDGKRTVWISYFVPVIYGGEERLLFKFVSNYWDARLVEVPRLVTGHYVHKTRQNAAVTLLRVSMNGLTTRRWRHLARFLSQGLLSPGNIRHKTIVYDDGPIVEQGKLVFCRDCPTAIVRDGKLLRCCTADYIEGHG